jgi:hypothetical protein
VAAFAFSIIIWAKFETPPAKSEPAPPVILILGVFTLYLTVLGTLVAAPLIKWLERRWRRLQPDSATWAQYEQATLTYPREHVAWLRTQQSWWRGLLPSDFEIQVASNLRQRGYEVLRTGRSRDGGVDIRVREPGGARIIVQCKAYQVPVGPAAVRELYGTLMHEGAQEGWLDSAVRRSSLLRASRFGCSMSIR